MKIGIRDKRVIAAFCDQRGHEGLKLDTDGQTLNGAWLGGNRIAYWAQGNIAYPETGSKTGDQIQKMIRRCATSGNCGRTGRTKRR